MSFKDLPDNTNYVNPANHKLNIFRLPVTEFFTQKIIMPSIRVQEITTGNPLIKLNFAASEVEYGNLQVVFKVDEDLRNYTEIASWMVGLGFPENTTQYKELKTNKNGKGGIRSDASIIITQSNNNAKVEVLFRDIFPTYLGGLTFDTTLSDAAFITATVEFSIRDFAIQTGPL